MLTVIEDELDAVRAALGANHEVGVTGALSVIPANEPKPRLPVVLIRSQGRSLAPTLTSTRKAIEEWQPEVVLLVGIAGGIVRGILDGAQVAWKEDGPVQGDIVVASYIHYAEYTKNVPSGTRLRYYPVDQPSSSLVQEHADPLRKPAADQDPWWSSIQRERPAGGVRENPEVFIGELIHVEGLAGDPRNAHQQWYLDRFDNAVGVDMESIGVARALHDAGTDVRYNPSWMCLRAVSDRVFAVPRKDQGATTRLQDVSSPTGTSLPNRFRRAGRELFRPSDPNAGIDFTPVDNNAERAEWKQYAAEAVGCFTRKIVERLLSEPRPGRPEDPGADPSNPWNEVPGV